MTTSTSLVINLRNHAPEFSLEKRKQCPPPAWPCSLFIVQNGDFTSSLLLDCCIEVRYLHVFQGELCPIQSLIKHSRDWDLLYECVHTACFGLYGLRCVVCEGALGHILKLNKFNLIRLRNIIFIIMYSAMRKALLIMSVCFVRLMNSFCHRQVTAMAERVVINEG